MYYAQILVSTMHLEPNVNFKHTNENHTLKYCTKNNAAIYHNFDSCLTNFTTMGQGYF